MYEIHCNDRPVSTGISSLGEARGWLAWHLDHASAEDPTGTLGRHADTLKALIATAAASAVFCLGADDFRIVPLSDNLIAPAYAIGVYHRDRSWLDDREVSQTLGMILPARSLREMHAIRRRIERQVDDEHQAVHALYRTTSGRWSERGPLPISEDEPL